MSDAVSSIRTVASFCAEEKVMQLYKKKCEVPIKAGIKQGLISGLGFGISFFFFFSVYAVSFYVGGVLVDHGKATFSEFFNVSIFFPSMSNKYFKFICFSLADSSLIITGVFCSQHDSSWNFSNKLSGS